MLDLGRHDSWDGVRAVVAGFGVSGFAAADNLTHLGASVLALDETSTDEKAEKAELLEVLGATVRLGAGETALLPDDVGQFARRMGPGVAAGHGDPPGQRAAGEVWDEAVEAFAMGQDLAGGPKHKQALECFTHAERLIGPQEPFEDGAGRQAPRPPLALVLSAVRNGLGEWHMDRAMRACRQRSRRNS